MGTLFNLAIGAGLVVGFIYVWNRWGRRLAATYGLVADAAVNDHAEQVESEQAVALHGEAVRKNQKRLVEDDEVIGGLQQQVVRTEADLEKAKETVTDLKRLEDQALDSKDEKTWTQVQAELSVYELQVDTLASLLETQQAELAAMEADYEDRLQDVQRAEVTQRELQFAEQAHQRANEWEKSRSALRTDNGMDLEKFDRLARDRVGALKHANERHAARRKKLTGDGIKKRLEAMKNEDAFQAALEARRTASGGSGSDAATAKSGADT